MKNLKERNPLPAKLLAIILLVVMCCTLSKEVLLWKVCKEQDRNLLEDQLFWVACQEEQELMFLKACNEKDRNLPPNTELLVSACTSPVATGVPGGEVLFVHEFRTDKIYLLDLRTGEKKDVPNDPLLLDYGVFLSSELVWLEGSVSRPESSGYRPHYILDLTDGQRYELLELDWLPRLEGFKFDPQYYAYFQTAEKVFIHHSKNALVALSPDFRQHPERNVVFYQYSLSQGANSREGELLEQLMKDLGKDYEIVNLSTTRYADLPSPTNRYVVRNDGIYLSGTNTPVVTRQYIGGGFMGGYFKSWYYDESGVVVQGSGTYLSSSGFGVVHIPIGSPILKLRLPAP